MNDLEPKDYVIRNAYEEAQDAIDTKCSLVSFLLTLIIGGLTLFICWSY